MDVAEKKLMGKPKRAATALAGEPKAKSDQIVTKRKRTTRPATAEGLHAHEKVRIISRVFKGDTFTIIKTMRTGTPASEVPGIASNLGISQERLFELLRLPKSTMKGRISNDGILSATEQDRVYRAEKILARAVEVLEDDDAAKAWINRENRSLGGDVPLSLLDTEAGYELVLDTLGRIEYGVVS